MFSRIRQLLAPPVLENEGEALAASLLRIILIIFAVAGLVVPILLNAVAVINPNDASQFEVGTFIMGLIVPLLALGLLSILHEGRVRLASVIITATLFV
ncbi:MAG: hypothetical protein GWN00_12250, partial [Aliifodinibius sp.]|nr:hypothetical protein [Fodinibius sp.]NIY25550.1 hypothetical protein [Fodinibius sp.]